jgi:hypothetical protein
MVIQSSYRLEKRDGFLLCIPPVPFLVLSVRERFMNEAGGRVSCLTQPEPNRNCLYDVYTVPFANVYTTSFLIALCRTKDIAPM